MLRCVQVLICVGRSGPDDYEFVEYNNKGAVSATTRVTKAAPQAQHEVTVFSDIVLRIKAHGRREIDPFWPDVALKTQVLLDACLASALAGGAVVTVPVPAAS